MIEYIKKEAIEKFIEKGLNNPDKVKAFGFDAVEILAEIQYMPAADVVQLRHGEWKQDEYTIRCSLCGFGMFPLYAFQDGEVAHGEFIPHYCPMCGAQMNKEDE